MGSWPASSTASRRSTRRNAPGSSRSGTAAMTSPPRISASRCGATGPSSTGSSQSEIALRSDCSDLDRAAARAEAEILTAATEGAAEQAAGELALDGEREIRGDRVSVGVDGERDVRVHGDGDSTTGGFQRSAATVAAREGGFDRASRSVGVHAASGFADVDAATGAVRADISADSIEIDRTSARLGVQGSLQVHGLDAAAGGLDAALSLDVAQMNGPARCLGLEVADEVAHFDPPA